MHNRVQCPACSAIGRLGAFKLTAVCKKYLPENLRNEKNLRLKKIICCCGCVLNRSTCTRSCGGGTQTQSRTVLQEPMYNGTLCGGLRVLQTCNENACPPTDCTLLEWSSWSSCSLASGKTCGEGTQTRSREIDLPAMLGGSCPFALTENGACALPCPIDCVAGEWGAWTMCDKACNTGTQTRVRNIDSPARFGGKCTASLGEMQTCNTG